MTTINRLTKAERERLTSCLAETHYEILRTVRGFSDRQLDFKSDPDRWSMSEIVEHMTIVHNLVQNYIEQVIGLPASSKESAWKGRDDALLEQIRSRSTPLKVPEIGGPKNQWAHDELFRRFEAIRNRMIEFAATTSAPLRSLCFPHPVFGEKDCYQWLLGTGAHCERHLGQIHEVVSSADFPKLAPRS